MSSGFEFLPEPDGSNELTYSLRAEPGQEDEATKAMAELNLNIALEFAREQNDHSRGVDEAQLMVDWTGFGYSGDPDGEVRRVLEPAYVLARAMPDSAEIFRFVARGRLRVVKRVSTGMGSLVFDEETRYIGVNESAGRTSFNVFLRRPGSSPEK